MPGGAAEGRLHADHAEHRTKYKCQRRKRTERTSTGHRKAKDNRKEKAQIYKRNFRTVSVKEGPIPLGG